MQRRLHCLFLFFPPVATAGQALHLLYLGAVKYAKELFETAVDDIDKGVGIHDARETANSKHRYWYCCSRKNHMEEGSVAGVLIFLAFTGSGKRSGDSTLSWISVRASVCSTRYKRPAEHPKVSGLRKGDCAHQLCAPRPRANLACHSFLPLQGDRTAPGFTISDPR